jgi:phytanoyl-CoA hydroxylase
MSYKADFERDDFLILPQFYTPDAIDALQTSVNATVTKKPPRITCDDMTTGERLLLKDAGRRRSISQLKINDLYLEMPNVRDLALNDRISPILSQLLEQTPLLCNSLYFEKGSVQPIHSDSLSMTPRTVNHLIAIWVALEDAHPDSGPLEYYPGSHKIEPMRFSDGWFHANQDEMPQWNSYVMGEVAQRGLVKQSFAAKKGDVFIWHANLMHGCGPISDLNRTRKSFVFHYFSMADGQFLTGDKIEENGAAWLRRPHPPVEPPKPAAPAPDAGKVKFSEKAYLARYSDVMQAVENGDFKSGRQHYDLFGRSEGRLPG